MTVEFLLVTFIIVASPGTGVVYTLAAGLTRGPRASVLAAFACTLGIVPHLAAAMLGLTALLHTSAVAYEALRYAGVLYLFYLAWRSLRETGTLDVSARTDLPNAMRVITEGVLINLLNPKLSIFFVAFLPQFITPGDPAPTWRMLELSAVFMAMTFGIFALYGLFAAYFRDRVISRPAVITWMRRTFAAAFVALGAKLALSER
jgi:threonine/homoserine/homoserine lactone efflux protein